MDKIKYRRALRSDYPAINEFYNEIYGRSRSMEEFEWEFHRSPAGPSVYVLAMAGSKIVGTNCVIPIHLIHSDGRQILSGKSEDTLVDTNYRGKGIFTLIYEKLIEECKKEGIEVIWGFTPVDKAFEKIGFEVPFCNSQSLAVLKVNLAFRYLSQLNPKNSPFEKFQIGGLVLLSWLRVAATRKSPQNMPGISERTEPANLEPIIRDELGSIVDGIAIKQGKAYQKWRYSKNPYLFDPHYLEFNQDGDVIGYATINLTKEKVCYIAEIKFSPNVNDSLRKSATQILLNYIKNLGACLVRNWHFDTNKIGERDVQMFKKSGFTILNRGIHFVWMNLTEGHLNPNNVLLTRAATQGLK